MPIARTLNDPISLRSLRAAVKMIALDLDGTLLDSQSHLSSENLDAIHEAAAVGIEIVIVTGRRFHSARHTTGAIQCDYDVIATNGALVKSKEGKTIERRLLPRATARKVLESTIGFRERCGVIFDRPRERQVVFERIDWNGPYVGPYLSRHREFVAETAPLTECLDEDPLEVMYIGECDQIAKVMAILQDAPFANEYTLSQTIYAHRNFSMLDVLRRGVNKGSALAAWAARQGVRSQDVMALGDNWNDREMLDFAGVPVLMGNALPELQALGFHLTLPNDASGVAHAIRKFAWKGEVD